MSEVKSIPAFCEVTREFEEIEAAARAKAGRYPTLGTAYGQLAAEMVRAARRHFARCVVCQHAEDVRWRA